MTRLCVTFFGLCALLSACAGQDHENFEYTSTYFVFFGRSIDADQGDEIEKGEAAQVSDAQWTAFESAAIAPILDGYTVLDGLGGYTLPRNEVSDQSVIHEHTKVLIYVDGDGSIASDVIMKIAERYKDQFHQHSVLVVQLPSEVTLVE